MHARAYLFIYMYLRRISFLSANLSDANTYILVCSTNMNGYLCTRITEKSKLHNKYKYIRFKYQKRIFKTSIQL